MSHRSILKSFIAAASVMTALPAVAEEFILSSWLPPQHPVVAEVVEPWAQQVEEATEGRVTIRILPKPLGPPPAHYDLVADGVADIAYGLHSYAQDNRFIRSQIGQFSFIGDTAEETSLAYWNVYGETLDAQDEHEDTKLLGLFVHGPGMFHNNQRAINTPEDLKGLKIRVPGGYAANLANELGITTQFMGPGQVFEKISTGVIDGVTFPMEGVKTFNLSEHLTNTMLIPGGMYNTSWFLVMNEDRWYDISDEDQAAIEKLSGEALARLAGQVWDAKDAGGIEHINASDMVVADAPAPVLDAIKAAAAKLEAEWAEAVAKTGYDGAAALEELRAATGQ